MNFEKNMRNIFGHAIFAAAVNTFLYILINISTETGFPEI